MRVADPGLVFVKLMFFFQGDCFPADGMMECQDLEVQGGWYGEFR